ncbi:hypothetical protein [Fimbriiglobus ruber]|nr:hypothetical protein [Fimbriiglobus ruber]
MKNTFSLSRGRPCAVSAALTVFGYFLVFGSASSVSGQEPKPPEYHIYAGSTHAHTAFTWSHGDQWAKPKEEFANKPVIRVTGGAQFPADFMTPKPEWKKLQGPPVEHFSRAKSHGYDFYTVTDHSQEADFQPPRPANANWMTTKKAAAEATDERFVALTGFEHSENDGPGGRGHINVLNTEEYINAMAPGVDLPFLYKWLKSAEPNGEGPVVATFNHPGPKQYNDWGHRDPAVTDIITMLEVINSNKKIHYEAFVNALDKGWKVSPVCGNDNHGYYGIMNQTSRTFVLATARTKAALLGAMKERRTYAALDQNIQCRYRVNGAIMGSTLDKPGRFRFDISISDPDTTKPKNKITKIDIVKDGGVVVEAYRPETPDYTVNWSPTIEDTTSKYFFIRVWNAGGGDAPNGNPDNPVAWLAPIWTGR